MITELDRRLARLFVAIVLGNWGEVERIRRDAPPGEPDRHWREAVLQVHLFAGIPRQVEAYEVLDRAGGLGAPEADERLAAGGDPDTGLPLFTRIYGRGTQAVQARLASFHADFTDWIVGHAYGRVLSRPGLGADRRELLAVCALVALGQDRQLASHTRGAIRCGATLEEIHAALDEVHDLIRPERWKRALAVIDKFARE